MCLMPKISSLEKLNSFIQWLDEEEQKRGWTDYQLSKRADLAASVISKARNGERPLGWDACVKIATALKLPATLVLEKAGLLPPTDAMSEEDKELVYLFNQLPEDRRREFLKMIRVLIPEEKE